MLTTEITEICMQLRIPGKLQSWKEFKCGNVNDTFLADCRDDSGKVRTYVLQKVNTYAFHRPELIMENIDMVTEHFCAAVPGRSMIRFCRRADGKPFVCRGSGFWRAYPFIVADVYNDSRDPAVVRAAGRGFGEFQRYLADFPIGRLATTIPGFHDTEKRMNTLFYDAHRDPCGKAAECGAELEYIASIREEACCLTRMEKSGELPLRVTHNDTKINNVLFDKTTHEPICVIDMDTVQPGLIAHDYGDAIRSAANTSAEDDPADQADVNMDVFRAFSEGFLAETAGMMTEKELSTLYLGSFVLACELSSRFLDDYLLGSPYFHIDYPEHNLVRARNQMALAQKIHERLPEMQDILGELARTGR